MSSGVIVKTVHVPVAVADRIHELARVYGMSVHKLMVQMLTDAVNGIPTVDEPRAGVLQAVEGAEVGVPSTTVRPLADDPTAPLPPLAPAALLLPRADDFAATIPSFRVEDPPEE